MGRWCRKSTMPGDSQHNNELLSSLITIKLLALLRFLTAILTLACIGVCFVAITDMIIDSLEEVTSLTKPEWRGSLSEKSQVLTVAHTGTYHIYGQVSRVYYNNPSSYFFLSWLMRMLRN
jgi:hypothetical protein